MTSIPTARIPSALTLSDLNTTINHEPRVLDTRLGDALGMTRPTNIRLLIERNAVKLARYGEVCTTGMQTSSKGGRPGKAYYLNEGQALCLSSLSDAPNAPDARRRSAVLHRVRRQGAMAGHQTSRFLRLHKRATYRNRDIIGRNRDIIGRNRDIIGRRSSLLS